MYLSRLKSSETLYCSYHKLSPSQSNLLLSSKKSSFIENPFNTFKEKFINTCIPQIRFSVEDQGSLD